MTYPEAIQFLYDLRWFGLKLGLENTFKLAALAGNPQERLRFIHVAGTNGKGSTCAMLESIYRAAGLRVGLFTSPHLVTFRERIQVNRESISETDVVRLVEQTHPWLGEFPKDHHPTFFEVVTVMTLRYFAEQRCELVIWETGMGGRLDATNIVTPLASVITNVQFDHQNWLGHTRAEIAAEKAGIIKPRVPVITATDAAEALEIIARTAREKNAPLTAVAMSKPTPEPAREGNQRMTASDRPLPSPRWVGGGLPVGLALPLLGHHQELNAAVAIATVQALQDIIPADDDAIRRGLQTVHWPGRLQFVKTKSGQTLLLDGAHNAAGADALRAALESEPIRAALRARLHGMAPEPCRQDAGGTLVLGALEDKDWRHICESLAPLAKRIFLAPVNSERSAPPEILRDACARANPAAETIACPSLADALKQTANDPFVVIAGSLYLVGEALELLGLSPAAGSERGLNEWTVKK